MIALGIDPGFSNLGIALLDDTQVVAAETFHKEEGASDDNQLEYLALTLDAWIEHSRAEVVAYEEQWRAQVGQVLRGRGNSRMHLAHEVVGMIRAISRYRRVSLVSVTPQQAKAAVGLKGKASKSEVKEAVRTVTRNPPRRLSQHSADAIAIALAGQRKYGEMLHVG